MLTFSIKEGRIASVNVIGDPERPRQIEIAVLDSRFSYLTGDGQAFNANGNGQEADERR